VKDLIANGFTVTAVGSRSQQSADRFAAEHGIPVAHASYADLAADPDVDVVYVASPRPMHYDDTKLVLNAGKHALVEKAFTVNADEARELVQLAESKAARHPRGDVDEVAAAHGPHPRDHRRRHPR
jgi:predicted dehydrogenase